CSGSLKVKARRSSLRGGLVRPRGTRSAVPLLILPPYFKIQGARHAVPPVPAVDPPTDVGYHLTREIEGIIDVPKTDLILLHAPSIYDFRKRTVLYGPTSDQVPSSPLFELYPIGIASIAEYLERAGYRVRIVNLAVRMLRSEGFDVESFIAKLEAPVFGIDLHWMLHCHGSIEIARIVKKYHPQSKVLFGGLSSSYFHRELMDYPEIDYVMRGDTTEEPVKRLMDCITRGSDPSDVPNLTWRDGGGTIRENPMSHVPNDLDGLFVSHYDNVIRSVIRYRDLVSYLPFKRWLQYPITAVLTCRGCTENCVICGGSQAAFRNCFNRHETAYRTPEAVVRDVKSIERFSKGPIFILGDLQQPGEDYAYELLDLLDKHRPKNQIIMELFNPAPRKLLQRMGEVCPGFCLEMSPESHDYDLRRSCGRNFSDADFEQTVRWALEAGCSRMDVFYMLGIPKQDRASFMATVDYCDHLWGKFNDNRLMLFTAPISPFLDPGSLAFENPDKFGYRLLCRTVEEHRQALDSPSWKYHLNYETELLSRADIIDTAYDAEEAMNRLKEKYGIIPRKKAEATAWRLATGREMLAAIDDIVASGDDGKLAPLKPTVDAVNMSHAGGKTELELPTALMTLRPLSTIKSLLTKH
ncbi:MAG: TIGR04190 family B12-binding domain/radical SAM domain protein, partial [Chloroflexota bacterium]|nr:TIGR04190 family B12-binding domain/radical SAM domain protein [Chloroflexota bacterium]